MSEEARAVVAAFQSLRNAMPEQEFMQIWEDDVARPDEMCDLYEALLILEAADWNEAAASNRGSESPLSDFGPSDMPLG